MNSFEASFESRKPSINIYAANADDNLIYEVKAGIEEEGVLFEVFMRNEDDLGLLAKNAAASSSLDVGIGVLGNSAEMRHSSFDGVIETVFGGDFGKVRLFGANAARFVKREPLRYYSNSTFH